MSRALPRILLTLALTALAVLAGTGTAQAEDGFRYWGYHQAEDGAWSFSAVGGRDVVPADGAVEGYRFGTATESQGIAPRVDLAEVGFEEVCGSASAAAGEKRVAVVVDYGTEADATGGTPPVARADCAVVPEEADGIEVAQAVSDLQIEDSGIICSLDGYPASGCGEAVPDAEVPADEPTVDVALPTDEAEDAAADEPSAESDATMTWVAVAALLVLLVAGAVVVSRRRRRT